MIYDAQYSEYVNLLCGVTYPKEKIVAYLRQKGQRKFSAQGRMMNNIELSDDFSQIKPHVMCDPYYYECFRFFVDDYPLKTALALEFLAKENYPIKEHANGEVDCYNITLLDYTDLIFEFLREDQNSVEDILDTIRQIIVLGYDLSDYPFFLKLFKIYDGQKPWDDYVETTNVGLKAKVLYQIVFEYGVNPCGDSFDKKAIELYRRYVSEVTLFELMYIELYSTRFNAMIDL
jgi:hypothetical protein